MGWGRLNPFKKKFWTTGGIFSGRNFLTGGAADLIMSMSKGGGGTILDKNKPLTPGGKGDVQKQIDADVAAQETAARVAAHNAEVAELAKGALGSVDLRRRRGSYATRLTGSSMGSNPASTGKTLLSQ